MHSILVSALPRLGLIAGACAGCLFLPAAHPKTAIVWRLQPGQVLRYQLAHQSVITLEVAERTVEQHYALVAHLRWEVTGVRDDGAFEIAQTLERVRVDLKQGDQATRYDSGDDAPLDDESARELQAAYRQVLETRFDLILAPDGRISEVKTAPADRNGGRSAGFANPLDGGSLLTAEGVRVLLAQAFPALPREPVAPGSQWTSEIELMKGPLLAISVGAKSELAALTDREATIKSELTARLAPARGSTFEMEINEQSGRGESAFDLVNGTLASSSTDQRMRIEFIAGDRRVVQVAQVALSATRIDAAKP